MDTLDELGTKYGTDKAHDGHNYMPMYEALVGSKKCYHILEIGLGLSGASARTWKDYFAPVEVWVIDNNPVCEVPGIHLMVGDQKSKGIWETLHSLNVQFDFVVDDGSHVPEDQVASFLQGFDLVKPHGYWFIEDTHCNFHYNYSDRDKLYPWLYDLITRQQIAGIGTGDFYRVRDNLAGICKDIYAFHLYKSVVVLEKA